MKIIKKFNQYSINEGLGVAEPTEFYLRRLTYIILEEFYNYVDSTRYSGEESETLTYEVVVPYNEIRSLIPLGQESLNKYSYFPVSEIILDLTFYKQTVEEMDGADFKVGGYASPFAKGREKKATRFRNPIKQLVDHSLSIHLGFSIYYSKFFRKINFQHPHFENTKLFKKVESVISHELNHAYEFYYRKLGRRNTIKLSPTMASLGENVYDVPKSIFDLWNNEFTYYIYNSEWHELNAQTQEANTYISRMSLDAFKRTILWKECQKMKNWKYEDFINQMKDEIEDEGMDISTIDRMVEYFCIELQNWSLSLREIPEIDPWKLYEKSQEEFFKIFEKRINNAGQVLQRNYLRLFAKKQD